MVYKNATIRHTRDGEMVGPKMHQAVAVVSWNGPIQSRNVLAKRIGPNGSQQYGYQSVNRAIRKGLLAIDSKCPEANPHGRGAVVIADKGEEYLNQTTDD